MGEINRVAEIIQTTMQTRTCRFCHHPLPPGRYTCDNPDCLRDQERRAKIDREREALEKAEKKIEAEKERLRKLYAGDNLAEIYMDTRFENLLVDSENESAIEGALKWALDFGSPRMKNRALWLCGKTGRGKTMLAYCVGNHLIARGIPLAYFSVRSRLENNLYASPRDDENRRRAIQARMDWIISARCVLLDDLGYEGEHPKDDFLRFLHALIDRQYSAGPQRGIIITSELTPMDLQPQGDLFRGGRYGDGTASLLGRIRQMSDRSAYQLGGDDWRTPPDGKPLRTETATPFPEWLKKKGMRG